MARRITAPRNETKSEPMLKSLWLMVPVPKSGARTSPPRNAPTMPTTTLRSMPIWSFLPMTMLASQPRMPPTISQRRKVIGNSVVKAADAAGGLGLARTGPGRKNKKIGVRPPNQEPGRTGVWPQFLHRREGGAAESGFQRFLQGKRERGDGIELGEARLADALQVADY